MTYQFSIKLLSLSKGKTLRLLQNGLYTSSQPLFFYICYYSNHCFKYTPLIHHTDIIRSGVTLLPEYLFNFLSLPMSYQHSPYFPHPRVQCWFVFTHFLSLIRPKQKPCSQPSQLQKLQKSVYSDVVRKITREKQPHSKCWKVPLTHCSRLNAVLFLVAQSYLTLWDPKD